MAGGDSVSLPAVTSITVLPATAALVPLDAIQLQAVTYNSLGNLVTGRSIAWTTSNAAIATVGASNGQVVAVAAGSATITASCDGVRDTATVTVSAVVGAGLWPNEKVGLTLVTDYGFLSVIPSPAVGAPIGDASGWNISQSSNLVTREIDLTAPVSAPYVVQFKYPVGFVGGVAPGTLYYDPGVSISEFYLGFRWKVSNPWQFHTSGINKVCQQFLGGSGGDMVLTMYGTGGAAPYLRVTTQFAGVSVNLEPLIAQTEVILGTWHTVELHVKKSTSLIEWWLDNVLQGHDTTSTFPVDAFVEFQFAPVWGGIGDTKTEEDTFSYDHVRIEWA